MPKSDPNIVFRVRVRRPAHPTRADWAFFVVPTTASACLPTRSQVSVQGEIEGHRFEATLQPDGHGSHWMKLDSGLLEKAGVAAGDEVEVSMAPMTTQPEPEVPYDWTQALEVHPQARATWDDITAIARRDWIAWITSGKKAETRTKRIATACDMLASGKRRACCFDRSGIYSGAFKAPEAAD